MGTTRGRLRRVERAVPRLAGGQPFKLVLAGQESMVSDGELVEAITDAAGRVQRNMEGWPVEDLRRVITGDVPVELQQSELLRKLAAAELERRLLA